MIDLVILDCDGVLVDTEALSARAITRALEAAGVPMTEDEVATTFVGLTDDTVWRMVEEKFGVTITPAHKALHNTELDRLFDTELTTVCAEVHEVLKAFPLPFCVASNSGHDRLRRSLGLTGLYPLFNGHVFSANDVPNPKPAPDLILHAAATMGVPTDRCIFFDDSVAGVSAGVAAGVRTVGFCAASHTPPDQPARLKAAGAEGIVHSFYELEAYVERSRALVD
ncbi:HAD family hydrolase [Acuticoccus kandeliae]|uniref:HAD family hydrolase n=1 Tax=Acuticoccus kandeliae TaxID=2073160 RepID=UPI001300260A|nr:HAD-IA family hydrolase [Acuticoccus kandeliae]